MSGHWDYLILTAANAQQAAAYELQLRERRELGLLPWVREILVVPDREGKRVGVHVPLEKDEACAQVRDEIIPHHDVVQAVHIN